MSLFAPRRTIDKSQFLASFFLVLASLQTFASAAENRQASDATGLKSGVRPQIYPQPETGSQAFWGLDFSPYEAGQDPNVNPQVAASQIQSRLEIIAPYTTWVRSFSVTTGLENIPPIAKALGLKVAAGAWISTNTTQNAQEVANLISAANAGNVDIAIVGSEVLLRGDQTEAQLIAYMNQVRAAIPAGIPVTTADTYNTLLAHPNVIAASDVIAANFYAYWEDDAIDNALCDLASEYAQVVSAAGGKQVTVSETGWPSGGVAQGAAVPTPANAAQFALQFVSWARAANVAYFYFEAFDEAWKAKYEGPQGAYWGVWDQTGAVKPEMETVVAGGITQVNCNAIPGGAGTPQLSLTYVPPYGSSDELEGQALHVPTAGYGIAVYIDVSGGWWTKPTFAQPVTTLQPDGTWLTPIVTGGSDQLATEIAAFLIPTSYSPPALAGSPTLPAALYSNSVANVQTSRSAQSISGTISDSNGFPLPGVLVTLTGATNAQITTTPDGKYSFADLTSVGPFTVTPTGDQRAYSPASQIFQSISANQPANFTTAGAIATYGSQDATTQGTWTGKYGADGYLIANDTSSAPAYATISFTGAATYTWAASTSDVRALQASKGATSRIASTYYAGSNFTMDVNLTDGNTHRIALYLLDWDSTARSETISIVDAASNTVLDTETFSGFHNGEYAAWNVQGHVLIEVAKTGGTNAVVSGIFFDPPALPTAAAYGGLDSATQGTWTGQYGGNGLLIANDLSSPPAYATVSLTGGLTYNWAATTTDARALQAASGSSARIASTFYSANTFTINVNLADGNTHKIALYLLDWDSTSRSETISVLDAASNAVLDTETFSGFHTGQYASWFVQGHVLIQVTRTGGANAVVSGIFFDPIVITSAQYVGPDSTTQGTWTGKYGVSGELIANDISNLPGFAIVSLTGDKPYTWVASTSDVRALQTSSGSSTRIASTFYSASSFTINVNLTDGNMHKISLYLLDWDSNARSETVSIVDAESNTLLDVETYSSFNSGVWAVWNVTGRVVIQVMRTGGANAVVSGIFVD